MKSAARIFYPFGRIRRVYLGPARGMRYVAEPGMGATYALGWERPLFRYLASRVRPGDTVFDVGANRGQMTLLFARLVSPSGRVVSFEPVPDLYESLRRNVELNGLAHVRCMRTAASDERGAAVFAFPSDRCTQGKLLGVEPTYRHESADTFEVPTVPLDVVVEETGEVPDVVKVDVEGAAAAVLRGAARLIAGRRPCFYIELHGPEERDGVRTSLVGSGYRVETVDGRDLTEAIGKWPPALWCRPR